MDGGEYRPGRGIAVRSGDWDRTDRSRADNADSGSAADTSAEAHADSETHSEADAYPEARADPEADSSHSEAYAGANRGSDADLGPIPHAQCDRKRDGYARLGSDANAVPCAGCDSQRGAYAPSAG